MRNPPGTVLNCKEWIRQTRNYNTMIESIAIHTEAGRESRILVGDSLVLLPELLPAGRVVLITDANVHRHYPELVDAYEHIIIGMGETNKTLLTVERIYKELLALGADRHTFLLGIGGGVVTDITGFVASTYMRGLRFGFVATTLLAQVDASIGGKNGVNVLGFKNIAGTFNQPDFVVCDTQVLHTLSEREFKAGLAEIVKAGIIGDRTLFRLFEETGYETIRNDQSLLTQLITRAILIKAGIVEADERETGLRKKLNLGHTFAHAIEKSTPAMNHGEAVAVGLAIVANISAKLCLLPEAQVGRITSVLSRMELPTVPTVTMKRLLGAIRQDKKKNGTNVSLVLIRSIGDCIVQPMELAELDRILTQKTAPCLHIETVPAGSTRTETATSENASV